MGAGAVAGSLWVGRGIEAADRGLDRTGRCGEGVGERCGEGGGGRLWRLILLDCWVDVSITYNFISVGSDCTPGHIFAGHDPTEFIMSRLLGS